MNQEENTAEVFHYFITQKELEEIPTGDFYNYILRKAVLVSSKISLERKKVVDFSWENKFGEVILTFYFIRHF